MLSAIRAFAKSPWATGLLALLIVSFGIWGIKDVFRNTGFSDAVVKAGSRPPITSAQFKDIFTEAKAQREQQTGQTIPIEEAVKAGLDRQLADQLAGTEATGALMSSEGVNPADELIAAELRKVTVFFSPITGQFDKQTYLAQLAQRHMTELQADNEFRDLVAQRHYVAALQAGVKAPRIYGLLDAAFQKEGRDFAFFRLDAKAVPAPPKPTDAQLTAFIKDNAAALTRPELRQISLVHFSAAALAATLAAPADRVQKRFDFEKDTLSTPEKRSLIQIPVKDSATGAAIAAKLKAGGDPQTVAKAAGLQATVYPATPKGAIADRKIADAAFGLKAGDVAGPIQGDLGMAVIKVLEITQAKVVTLADPAVRKKIEDEVKQDLAKEKINEIVDAYDKAHDGGAGMAQAAKAAGQAVIAVPEPIMQQGGTLSGARANLPPKVLQAAFTIPAGTESEVIDIGQGESWVVHVDKIMPPALFGLDEKVGQTVVRDAVERQFQLRALFTALHAKADALVGDIAKGKTLDAAAADVGAKVEQAQNVTQAAARPTAPGQPAAYAPDLLSRIFQARIGDVVVGQDTKAGLIVAKLLKVQEPAASELAGIAEASRGQTSRALAQDLAGATRIAAEHKIKPIVDYKKAQAALGFDPDALAKKPAS